MATFFMYIVQDLGMQKRVRKKCVFWFRNILLTVIIQNKYHRLLTKE